MQLLPDDPISRTWSRKVSEGTKTHLRRRHPGRNSSTQDVLKQSIMKLSESHDDSGHVRRLSQEVADLAQCVRAIQHGLSDVMAHLKNSIYFCIIGNNILAIFIVIQFHF